MFSLGSVANSRELGGYVLPDGSIVREGLLLRGGSLAKASDKDIASMSADYHVRKIFDFRTSMELKYAPDREVSGAQNIWMPAFDEETMRMKNLALPHDAYRDLGNWLIAHACEPAVQETASVMYSEMVMGDFTQVQYAGFLQNILSTTDGAVYWHCSQGKDRTGLGSALILAALGADRKLIMKDFELSNVFYREELDFYQSKVNTPEEKAVMQTFIGVNPEYFSAALDLIEKTWGSMKNYLTGPLCLSEEDLQTLRSRYLRAR